MKYQALIDDLEKVSDVRVKSPIAMRQKYVTVQAAVANPTSWSAERPRPGLYMPNNSPIKNNNTQATKLHMVVDWFNGCAVSHCTSGNVKQSTIESTACKTVGKTERVVRMFVWDMLSNFGEGDLRNN